MGGSPEVHFTVGAEGFEPPVATVDAGKSFDLEVQNDTQAVQTVTVQGRPRIARPAGRDVQPRHRRAEGRRPQVTLSDAPFEATIQRCPHRQGRGRLAR